jgi:hypothetical protein
MNRTHCQRVALSRRRHVAVSQCRRVRPLSHHRIVVSQCRTGATLVRIDIPSPAAGRSLQSRRDAPGPLWPLRGQGRSPGQSPGAPQGSCLQAFRLASDLRSVVLSHRLLKAAEIHAAHAVDSCRDDELLRLHLERVESRAVTLGELQRANRNRLLRGNARGRQSVSTRNDSPVDIEFHLSPVRVVIVGDDELSSREPHGGAQVDYIAGRGLAATSGRGVVELSHHREDHGHHDQRQASYSDSFTRFLLGSRLRDLFLRWCRRASFQLATAMLTDDGRVLDFLRTKRAFLHKRARSGEALICMNSDARSLARMWAWIETISSGRQAGRVILLVARTHVGVD